MDDSLKASVTEVVGQILEIRNDLISKNEHANKLKQELKSLEKTTQQLHKDLEFQKKLLNYVLETGEDPVAASLQLSSKEIDSSTKKGAKSMSNKDIFQLDWYDDEISEKYLDPITNFKNQYLGSWQSIRRGDK